MAHRRDILLGAAAAAALPKLAPAQGTAAPGLGFHKVQLGNTAITVVNDGVVELPNVTQGLVTNAAPDAVSAALAAAGTPGPGMRNTFNQTVVSTRDGLVLIDVGFGPQGGPPGTGRMLDHIRAAGLDPANIRTVVFTHFHGDHIGGLLDAQGNAAFPNAAIKVPEGEWAFWLDEGEASRAPEARRPAFANARRRFAPYAARVERFRPGAEVAPGVTSIPTFGHSPGHASFLVSEGREQLLVIGDAVNTPALFMANPEWVPVFDMDPATAVATRRALLDRAAAERMPVVGYHFPMPATGRVERAGTGYRLVPS
ncbi:MBL fold metallo-hydrolase [Muricoccus radiodurans]|uniref:MBL fold metallo-hydrolase n=1 Tax=Muricoccus radiodurans TaxID=2231721 RepID=UPI003CFBAEAB